MPLAKVRVLAFVRVLHVFISKPPHATFARTMPTRMPVTFIIIIPPREARFLALCFATVAIIAVVFVVMVFVII
jgi:membrane-anchored protein YejM (alkaline phosphatase superfamily)